MDRKRISLFSLRSNLSVFFVFTLRRTIRPGKNGDGKTLETKPGWQRKLQKKQHKQKTKPHLHSRMHTCTHARTHGHAQLDIHLYQNRYNWGTTIAMRYVQNDQCSNFLSKWHQWNSQSVKFAKSRMALHFSAFVTRGWRKKQKKPQPNYHQTPQQRQQRKKTTRGTTVGDELARLKLFVRTLVKAMTMSNKLPVSNPKRWRSETFEHKVWRNAWGRNLAFKGIRFW